MNELTKTEKLHTYLQGNNIEIMKLPRSHHQ